MAEIDLLAELDDPGDEETDYGRGYQDGVRDSEADAALTLAAVVDAAGGVVFVQKYEGRSHMKLTITSDERGLRFEVESTRGASDA